jgi:polysaccharide pyruvyl transferase CsaB
MDISVHHKKETTMKIVLSGYYGFDNAGDEAILSSIIELILEEEKKAVITVLSNNPQRTEKDLPVNAVNRWNIKEILTALSGADRLISGGGSLFQDITGPRSIVYYSGVIWAAKLMRVPVSVFAQGVGPLRSKRSRYLTAKTMNQAEKISVRDNTSKKLLQNIGVKKTIKIVPDPVLSMEINSAHSLDKEAPITVSIRDWKDGKNHLKKVAQTLDKLLNKGEQIVLVPMHGEDDAKTAAQVISYLEVTERGGAVISEYDAPVKEKMRIIAESKHLIGMRLHALIFAAAADVPFTAVSYDPKIESFAQLCGQEAVCHVEDESWTADDLFIKIEAALASEKELRKSMGAYVQSSGQLLRKTIAEAIR